MTSEQQPLRTSWIVSDPEADAKGTSLDKRAEKRVSSVKLIGNRLWRVGGDTKLGDAYPEYIVDLPEGSTKYECSCYGHAQGNIRRRKMCSHVLAVVKFRKTAKGRVFIVDDVDEVRIPAPSTEPPEQDRVVTARTGQGDDDAEAALAAARAEADRRVNLDPDTPLGIHDAAFGAVPYPPKFTMFRAHQWKAITEINDHINNGVRVVMLSAPTGSGKTLIGEAVRRLQPGSKVYCCTTKSLQEQIAGEFSYASVIKGRSNYPTMTRPDLTAEDCTGNAQNQYECDWCPDYHSCAYQVAKQTAAVSPLPVLNIAYYMAETSAHQGSLFKGRSLTIIDEADTLEDQLMGAIEVVLTARLRHSIGVYSLPKKTVPEDWTKWLSNEIVPALNRRVEALKRESRSLLGIDTQKVRQIKRLEALKDRIRPMLKPDFDTGKPMLEEDWVMTGYEGSADNDATIRFKPVRVAEYAHEFLWSRGNQFLLMTATLISPEQTAEDLGLREDEWEVVHVDSVFPVENRPVFVQGVASMTNKTKEQAWPQMAEEIGVLIDDNPGVRILVHTVSYHLTRYLQENILCDTRHRDAIMSYTEARNREMVLKRFLEIEDAVMLAPSFERGIDLPEEDCQVIIIAKVPFPYLGDKQINARLRSKGGQSWYAVQTIRSIVQMTGRGMRSETDWCDTFVLDSQFKRLYREHRTLFPKWWRESVVLSMTDPKYRGLVKAARKRREERTG